MPRVRGALEAGGQAQGRHRGGLGQSRAGHEGLLSDTDGHGAPALRGAQQDVGHPACVGHGWSGHGGHTRSPAREVLRRLRARFWEAAPNASMGDMEMPAPAGSSTASLSGSVSRHLNPQTPRGTRSALWSRATGAPQGTDSLPHLTDHIPHHRVPAPDDSPLLPQCPRSLWHAETGACSPPALAADGHTAPASAPPAPLALFQLS